MAHGHLLDYILSCFVQRNMFNFSFSKIILCPLLFLLYHFSLVVGRVGKTSLVLRYVNNVFSDKQEATVQASYLTKHLVVEGVPITLSIWVRCHLFDMF